MDTIGTARLKSPAEVILYELSIGPVALQSYISVAVDWGVGLGVRPVYKLCVKYTNDGTVAMKSGVRLPAL